VPGRIKILILLPFIGIEMPSKKANKLFYAKLRKMLEEGKIKSRLILFKKINFVYLTTSLKKIDRKRIGPLKVKPSENHDRFKALCKNPDTEAYSIVYNCKYCACSKFMLILKKTFSTDLGSEGGLFSEPLFLGWKKLKDSPDNKKRKSEPGLSGDEEDYTTVDDESDPSEEEHGPIKDFKEPIDEKEIPEVVQEVQLAQEHREVPKQEFQWNELDEINVAQVLMP
jgi:hypothetical protein